MESAAGDYSAADSQPGVVRPLETEPADAHAVGRVRAASCDPQDPSEMQSFARNVLPGIVDCTVAIGLCMGAAIDNGLQTEHFTLPLATVFTMRVPQVASRRSPEKIPANEKVGEKLMRRSEN